MSNTILKPLNLENPENENLYRRAKALEKSGLFNEAEQIYNQIFNNSPSNEKYYNALKKVLIRSNDCIAMMNNVLKFCEANNNNKYSKINLLEILIICNGDWEKVFKELIQTNIKDRKYLKKIISKTLNNNKTEMALSAINNVRLEIKDISFFANELGYYYLSMKDYDNALNEFLNHLEKFPAHLKMINERVMSFPNEKNINNNMINILKESQLIESKVILADLYFKIEDFSNAINLLKEYNFLNELLSIAINLNALNQFELSTDLFFYIIENSNGAITQKAIFELAKSLEKRGLVKKANLQLSGFMNSNENFTSPFVRINEREAELMYKAIALYDSLSVNANDLHSEFRLSEIRFKALGDLDAAYNSYMKIYQNSRNKDLKMKSVKRLADVLAARGDLDSAIDIIDDELVSNIWNEDDKVRLKIKQNQFLFYNNEFDFIFNDFNTMAKQYSMQEKDYNNIIEIMSILILFKEYPEIFKEFAGAQLKIHQNKRTEAINILNSISQKPDYIIINNLINYQIANLLVYQNKINEAIQKLETISGDDIYNELAQILLAEIYDHILNDSINAKIYYISILKNFPNSIYNEQIRLRLKQIMENPL